LEDGASKGQDNKDFEEKLAEALFADDGACVAVDNNITRAVIRRQNKTGWAGATLAVCGVWQWAMCWFVGFGRGIAQPSIVLMRPCEIQPMSHDEANSRPSAPYPYLSTCVLLPIQ
jgi:hypothetical protein